MALTRSLPTLAADGLTSTEWRQIQTGMVARSAAGVPRTGILPAHYDPLVTGKASMGFNIAPFVAALSRMPGMVEFLANPELADFSPVEYVAPNANRRIDLIWVRSRFTDATDPSNQPVFGITLGDPSGTPTEPAIIPAGAEILASVETPSTATTTQSSGVIITPRHRFTSLGDIVPVRTQAEMDAWTPADGASVYRLDLGRFFRRKGGVWVSDVVEKSGVFTGTTGSGSSGGAVTVAHGLPGTPSAVFLTDDASIGLGGLERTLRMNGKNATEFQVLYERGGSAFEGNPVGFYWRAVL